MCSPVYVPHEHANGDDFFEYEASDCAGNIFRTSEKGTVSFSIAPINDAPVPVTRAFNLTVGTQRWIPVSEFVSDVETPTSDLVVVITA